MNMIAIANAKVNVGTGEDHYVVEVEPGEVKSTHAAESDNRAVGSEEEENDERQLDRDRASQTCYLLLIIAKLCLPAFPRQIALYSPCRSVVVGCHVLLPLILPP